MTNTNDTSATSTETSMPALAAAAVTASNVANITQPRMVPCNARHYSERARKTSERIADLGGQVLAYDLTASGFTDEDVQKFEDSFEKLTQELAVVQGMLEQLGDKDVANAKKEDKKAETLRRREEERKAQAEARRAREATRLTSRKALLDQALANRAAHAAQAAAPQQVPANVPEKASEQQAATG